MQLINTTGVVFHRNGGLNLTSRFRDDEWPAIDPTDWKVESSPVNIVFSCGSGFQSHVTVRELSPRSGDSTGRWITDKAGNNHWVNLPSYAVVDLHNYLDEIRVSIPREVVTWANTESDAHREAMHLINRGLAPELKTLLCYDFRRRQKTRSAYLIGGNKLGIHPLPEDSQTMPGQSPLPRLITAQCDNIMSMYLTELLEELFGDGDGSDGALSKRFRSQMPLDTHIGYVALRVLVQGSVLILIDKERRNYQNNVHDYSLHVQLQDSLNRVLSNFSTVHRGISYLKLMDQLPEKVAFYDSISKDALANPVPDSEPWKNIQFWIPTLGEVLVKPYQEKHIFSLV